MTVEQLIEKLQELIGRGTISPTADIRIRVFFEEYMNKYDELDNIELELHATKYNRLYIQAR